MSIQVLDKVANRTDPNQTDRRPLLALRRRALVSRNGPILMSTTFRCREDAVGIREIVWAQHRRSSALVILLLIPTLKSRSPMPTRTGLTSSNRCNHHCTHRCNHQSHRPTAMPGGLQSHSNSSTITTHVGEIPLRICVQNEAAP